jgi:hypothetical protein
MNKWVVISQCIMTVIHLLCIPLNSAQKQYYTPLQNTLCMFDSCYGPPAFIAVSVQSVTAFLTVHTEMPHAGSDPNLAS